jgi:L-ribulose-5-phosphate 4-epimerase
MKASDMVVVSLCGKTIEGKLNPSSDTPTHITLYKEFVDIGGIVHTHSTYATAWSQAGIDIPVIGTTHADYFYGAIPCTRDMTEDEIGNNYEKETGIVIKECFRQMKSEYIPGVLVKNHGPFAWGKDVADAVHNAFVMEQVAKIAYIAKQINPSLTMNHLLTEKHFKRKHGASSYYGQ